MTFTRYLLKYKEQGVEKQTRAYTYDIETYILNFKARRKGIQIVGYEIL